MTNKSFTKLNHLSFTICEHFVFDYAAREHSMSKRERGMFLEIEFDTNLQGVRV